MSNVFITGDRAASPVYMPLVSIEMLRAVNAGNKVLTGVNSGVEELVRSLADLAGVEVEVVEQSTDEATGKPNWDERTARLAHPVMAISEIVAVHADPHASSVVKSLLAGADSKTRLVTPADLLA